MTKIKTILDEDLFIIIIINIIDNGNRFFHLQFIFYWEKKLSLFF